MKLKSLWIAGLLSLQTGFAQIPFVKIIPDSTLNTATAAVIDRNMVVVQSDRRVFGVNTLTNRTVWNLRTPYYAMAGSLSNTNREGTIYFQALRDINSQTGIIYRMVSETGTITDSTICKGITFINLVPVPGNEDQIGFIGQQNRKFIAAILNYKTGSVDKVFFKEGDAGNSIPNSLCFSPDGKTAMIAIINDRYEIRSYSVSTGSLMKTLATPNTEIHQMVFSSDGKKLFFPDSRGKVWIVKPDDLSVENTFAANGKPSFIAVSSNNKYAVLSGGEGTYMQRIYLENGSIETSNLGATSFSCTTNSSGKYAIITTRGVGPYFITRYPYCIMVAIDPANTPYTNSNPENTNTIFMQGDAVYIEWNGTWYKGVILEVSNGKYKVHYNGYGNEWDEWVESNRLKK